MNASDLADKVNRDDSRDSQDDADLPVVQDRLIRHKSGSIEALVWHHQMAAERAFNFSDSTREDTPRQCQANKTD